MIYTGWMEFKDLKTDGQRVFRVSPDMDGSIQTLKDIKEKMKFVEIWDNIDSRGKSRYFSLAKTALEEASMWLDKGDIEERFPGIKIKE